MFRIMIACVVVTACRDTPGVECADGALCPDETTCRVIAGVDRCLTDAQLVQCDGKPDREACEVSAGVAGLCNQGACLRVGCGDGFASGTEQCDGSDLDGRRDCRDIGYYGEGVLGCSPDCTFDQSGCSNLGKCGDGIINNTEQCDSADLGDNNCTTAGGYYVADGLACNDACRFDFTACSGFCGDGVVDANEECDRGTGGSAQFASAFDNCQDLDYYRDVPITICNNNCRVARTECDATAGFCGDGIADLAAGEECDESDLGLPDASGDSAIDCRDLEALPGQRYYQGALSCRPSCTRDSSACEGFCGDGEKTAPEACDKLDLGTTTCGAYGGDLACDATCTAITGACLGSYGDGVLNGNERCDGVNFGGLSCSSFGYNVQGLGGLACASGAIDSMGCAMNGYCGDGVVQGVEQCDGADSAGNDCTSMLGAGPLDCDENCQIATGTCQNAFWSRSNIPNPLGAPIDLVDGYTPNTTSLWLASRFGDIWQWDGERWHERDLEGVPAQPRAIGGIGDDVWLAADMGASMVQLFRWVWIGPVSGMWMFDGMLPDVYDFHSDGTRLWAATRDGVWQRTTTTTWSKVVEGWYFAIDGRDGIVMAAGKIDAGTNMARRDRDGTWQRIAITLRDHSLTALRTISVISRDQALVTQAGNEGPEHVEPIGTAVHYWDGIEAWDLPLGPNPPDTFVLGTAAGEGDDVWILKGGTTPEGNRMSLFHYTGYSDFDIPNIPPTTLPIGPVDYRRAKILGSDPGNLWILGDGAVAHYEGPGWHTAPARHLRDLAAPTALPRLLESDTLQENTFTVAASNDNAVWMAGCTQACGEALVIEHRDEGVGIANAPPRNMGMARNITGPVEAMAIDDAGWVWAATGLTVRAIGNARGIVGPAPAPATLHAPATSATSLGARVVFGTATMFGQPPKIYVHDASGWSSLSIACATCTIPQLDSIEAIGASGPSDVWIAGGDVIARWNGNVASPSWRIESDSGVSPNTVAGIWVANAHEAWVVKGRDGEPGAVVQITWGDTGAPSAGSITRADGGPIGRMRGVWGSSSQDVWFVSDGAEALHWDGARLAGYALPRGGARAITGTGAQDVWVVGAGGAIARLNQRLPSTTAGACANAVPIYCAQNTVQVRGSVGEQPVVYRLVSPLAIGTAKGEATVVLQAVAGTVNVDVLEARVQQGQSASMPSLCEPHMQMGPLPPPETTRTTELVRGAWKYFVVTNRGSGDGTYSLDLSCELQ